LTALVGWVYDTTGSTGQASLLLLARLAPPVLGGGIAALVVDRLPKQRLLVWIELARGLAVAGALYGVVSGGRTTVFAALAVSGGLAAISNACVPSLLPSLLPAEQLASANAGLGIAKDGAMAAGALGSALILSSIGVAAALVVDVGTFAVSLVLFSLIRAPLRRGREEERREEPPRTGGLRYVVSRRWLLVLVFSFAAATLATGLTNATLPRLLEDKLGFGPGGYGFGIAALATGLALGQALVGFARVGETAGRWIGAGLLVMAGLFGVLGLVDHAPTALLVLGAIGFVDGTTDVLFETVVQREADPRRYGAVFGFSYAFITMTMMGAVALAPLVNSLVSPGVAILGAGALLVGAGAIALLGMPTTAAAPRPGGVLREGLDLSVVAANGLGPLAETAAALLASEGVSVEVLELNGNPAWNEDAVLATVRKTSKIVLVHGEAGGTEAAGLVAVIAERAFEDLDGPVRRVRADADLAAELRDLAAF
ncbi:MAG TPA: MFS transporter, partial [Gaiellaceae bacterium]